jgi:hypothetical protein
MKVLGLRVVYGWRIKSAHLIGQDCALIDNNFFAITRKGNSYEFVDFERQVTFPAPSFGCVLDEDGLGIATRTGFGR